MTAADRSGPGAGSADRARRVPRRKALALRGSVPAEAGKAKPAASGGCKMLRKIQLDIRRILTRRPGGDEPIVRKAQAGVGAFHPNDAAFHQQEGRLSFGRTRPVNRGDHSLASCQAIRRFEEHPDAADIDRGSPAGHGEGLTFSGEEVQQTLHGIACSGTALPGPPHHSGYGDLLVFLLHFRNHDGRSPARWCLRRQWLQFRCDGWAFPAAGRPGREILRAEVPNFYAAESPRDTPGGTRLRGPGAISARSRARRRSKRDSGFYLFSAPEIISISAAAV